MPTKTNKQASRFDRAVAVFKQHGGILRTAQAIRAGIHPSTLYAMRDVGTLEVVSRGVFRLAGSELPNRSRTVNPSSDHNHIEWIFVKIDQWYTFHNFTINLKNKADNTYCGPPFRLRTKDIEKYQNFGNINGIKGISQEFSEFGYTV
jgi:hypothetical protein